ncbi:MAG: serine hydrolase [Kordiimonadaceae bacterium]|nr:serine hydrolase [Kordiimonadaceae bacterium]
MKFLKNKWFWISLPFIAVSLTLVVSDMARRFIIYSPTMLAAASAKIACSSVFVMNRDPEEVLARDIKEFYGGLMKVSNISFDMEEKSVTGTVLGVIARKAIYRPGVGCTVLIDVEKETLLAQAEGITEAVSVHRPEVWPKGDTVLLSKDDTSVDWVALETAIDGAFEDNTENKTIDTRAIIVVKDGKTIAERYAQPFGPDTRFLGWSASKSVMSALIGTMVMDGKLQLDAPAPVAEWRAEGDPRRKISLSHLLTMSSGLEFSEPYIPNNDSTDMLFKSPRMGDFAASKPLYKEPGSFWYYSSGTTNLLGRIFFETAGGTLQASHSLAHKRLFEPLGMTSAMFEPDTSGAFVGSSYFYATARDWARFGLLYLNDGKVGDKQILSKEWVDYSHEPIEQAPRREYGAQFWLNAGNPDESLNLGPKLPDVPRDYYMASGYNNQHVGIVPSKNAIVVRLGWTTLGSSFDLNGHFAAILNALPVAAPIVAHNSE